MKRCAFLMLATLSLAGVAHAQPPMNPAGPPPQFAEVSSVDQASKTIILIEQRQTPQFVQKIIQVKEVVNGQEIVINKVVPEQVMVPIMVQTKWTAANLKATDIAGNAIGADALLQRLKQGDAVLMLPAGQQLHPAYRRLFQKDAIVLTTVGG